MKPFLMDLQRSELLAILQEDVQNEHESMTFALEGAWNELKDPRLAAIQALTPMTGNHDKEQAK